MTFRTLMTVAAGIPSKNQGVHLPWTPLMVPHEASAPSGPAVKNPMVAAMPCSKPVTVFLTRTLSTPLSIGSGMLVVVAVSWLGSTHCPPMHQPSPFSLGFPTSLRVDFRPIPPSRESVVHRLPSAQQKARPPCGRPGSLAFSALGTNGSFGSCVLGWDDHRCSTAGARQRLGFGHD